MYSAVTCSREEDNEASSHRKVGEFLDYLVDYQFLMKDSALCM